MTEKNYNPEQKNMKAIKQQNVVSTTKVDAPKINEEKKTEIKEVKNESEKEKKPETKKKEIPKIKKSEAMISGKNLHLSMKRSRDFCRFIKNKKIVKAISDLEEVLSHKKAVPAKGEIPHKPGKKMAGGIYADKTAEHFLRLLQSLQANANALSVENPIIAEAIANIAPRPFGKFGRVKRKRAHVKLIAREKSILNKLKKKK